MNESLTRHCMHAIPRGEVGSTITNEASASHHLARGPSLRVFVRLIGSIQSNNLADDS